MEIKVKSASPGIRSGCLAVAVYQGGELSATGKALDQAAEGALGRVLKQGDLQGEAGQTLMLHNLPGIAASRVLLVGLGRAGEVAPETFLKAVDAAVRAIHASGARDAALSLAEEEVAGRDTGWKLRQQARLVETGTYRFDELRKADSKRPVLRRVDLLVPGRPGVSARRACDQGAAIGRGMNLARDLGNRPGNICTPTHLARQARALEKRHPKLKVKVLDEKAMQKLGMGALLAVARGSHEPAKLILLEYRNGPKGQKPVALVGKGVTFDSGGISIKPSQAMDEMKFDMCGAASVLGTFSAVMEMDLPINLVGVIPSTENLPGGSATKPGDIVTSLSGQTIEILNTDAEGRLILCDALSYVARYKPELIIDIATLTGACVIALGKHHSGLLGNDEALINALREAGQVSGDRAWPLPIGEEYDQQLKSNFADMANIGGREAGTITAACFLARFTRGQRWAHLDIAGTAWLTGKEKGATGRPVPLLTQFLLDRAGK